MSENDLAVPCPYCGHHTLYRPEGWVEGGPVACANPFCDSNQPPACRHERVRTLRSIPHRSECLDCGATVERQWVRVIPPDEGETGPGA